jgi:hypothetical protein
MRQWPLKILLVHPEAEFMQDRKITIAADCAVVVDKEIVERFGEEPLLIGCPMLEDPRRVFEKLKFIMRESNAEEIDVYTMEVPCCHAIHLMVDRANDERESMGKEKIKLNRYIVRVSGRVEPYSGKIDHEMREAEARAHRGR